MGLTSEDPTEIKSCPHTSHSCIGLSDPRRKECEMKEISEKIIKEALPSSEFFWPGHVCDT